MQVPETLFQRPKFAVANRSSGQFDNVAANGNMRGLNSHAIEGKPLLPLGERLRELCCHLPGHNEGLVGKECNRQVETGSFVRNDCDRTG